MCSWVKRKTLCFHGKLLQFSGAQSDFLTSVFVGNFSGILAAADDNMAFAMSKQKGSEAPASVRTS